MKALKLESQGLNNYLVYEVEETETIDTLALGMLNNNKITGIAPVIHTQMDENIFFKYNVSDKISAKEYFSGVVNKKRLLCVFSGILSAVISAEEYMIDVNTLIFDLDYIYVNASTGATEMICVPIRPEGAETLNLGLFFKNIMFTTQFDSNENSNYVAVIMNFLNSNPALSAENFKKTIDELAGNVTVNVTVNGLTDQRTEADSLRKAPANNINMELNRDVTSNIQAENTKNRTTIGNQPSGQTNIQLSEQLEKKTGSQSTASQKMVTPGTVNILNTPQKENVQNDVTGKEISWLYLMQHFNKENAALYKEQQKRKKVNKANKAAKKSKDKKKTELKVGYTVPGAPGITADVQKALNNQPASFHVSVQEQTSISPQPTYTPPPLSQGTANFGETVVLNQDMGAGETTVLNETMQNTTPYLVRVKTGERIMVDKPVFRVGKEKSLVDYFISDNTTISRNHINIISRGNEYFVVDLKSTNHTYVNGSVIADNVETKISHGTRIRLSNEEFEFNTF